ncbi:hypothetical protein [Paenibacillus methanolicus]|uniref:Uncharacterized protein n=1 Tax=Paenibacillus methanolicus TaxID=582686 RepID=A0A5S5CKY2_9BACL|nr:hypothetical protein [Paenibacillus methanolicus]TYP79201.1 hypothetical protein BCM02_101319 [Paenibacillus methanolicus]
MPNMVWYYGLIAIGVIITAFTLRRRANLADWLTYFLFTTAWSWVGESFILFVFHGYDYKPGLYQDVFAENIIGHIIANSSYWAAAAVAVMYYRTSYLWIAIYSLGFMLTEFIFTRVGVYEQYWWKTYMTGITAFIFLVLMKKWYVLLQARAYKSPRVIVFGTLAWVILQTPTSVLMLFDKQFFRVHWVTNIYRDSTLFSGFVYHVIMAFVILYCMYVPRHWAWRMAPLILLAAFDALLFNAGILRFSNDWSLIELISIRAVSLAVIFLLEHYSLEEERVSGEEETRWHARSR